MRKNNECLGDAKLNDEQLLERIVCNPKILAGKPIVRGTRLSVEFLLNLLGRGTNPSEILDEYSGLTADDLRACQLFAARSISEIEFVPLREMA